MATRLDVFGDGTVERRFWPKVRHSDGCWEWLGQKSDRGYGRFRVGRSSSRYAHRVAYELINGPLPDDGSYHGVCVLHRCDNPGCVRPDHLFLGSQADNIRDMDAKGRGNRIGLPVSNQRRREVAPFLGEKNPSAKLSLDDVMRIKAFRREGRTLLSIGVEFGVAFQTVGKIVNRTRWQHVF